MLFSLPIPDLLLTYARYNRDFNAVVIYEGGNYRIAFRNLISQ